MRRELEAVVHELRRLKRDGVGTVYVSDANMQIIHDWSAQAARNPAPAGQPEEVAYVRRKEEPLPELVLPATSSSAVAAGGGGKPEAAPEPVPSSPVFTLPAGDKTTQWNWLREKVLSDPFCKSQVKADKQVVFGVGSLDADIFFCGEAPGADEEIQGEPFVGPAGQLLTKIIQAMGLGRERVYIGNIMNYRPPMPVSYGNRPPRADEMAYCLPYLQGQLAIVQPKVIVALGKTAVDGLLGPDPKRKMGQIRGKWSDFSGIPLMPTFHPSYLLRNNTNRTKRDVWEDMMLVMEKIGLPISEKQKGYFL